MEELNPIQDHSLDSTKRENEYTQEDSADWDFEDITDLLQLDDIIAEGQVIDELSSQSCEGGLVNEISQSINTLVKKTFKSKDTKENKEDNLMQTGYLKKNSLNIKINNKNCRVDEIRCDPYIIEDDGDLKEVQKDFVNSELTKKNVTIIEPVRKKSKEKNKNIAIIEPSTKRQRQRQNSKINKINNKTEIEEINACTAIMQYKDEKYESIEALALKVEKGRQKSQLMSTEKADEILKDLLDKNNCEMNVPDVGLQCKDCGFYSENVQERIEHLNGVRHEAVKGEVKKAIILGILENYTKKTFYCTVCSWFITDIEPIIEHILSRRHKDAILISRYDIPGVLQGSFCYNCKSILKSNEIYHHMFVHNHDSIYNYFSQLKKHVIIKLNKKNEVYCCLCRYYIRLDETEKHLKYHEEVCHYFNRKIRGRKCYYSPTTQSYECNLHHECVICRGNHRQIECPQMKNLPYSSVFAPHFGKPKIDLKSLYAASKLAT